jgi:hypothetical protein
LPTPVLDLVLKKLRKIVWTERGTYYKNYQDLSECSTALEASGNELNFPLFYPNYCTRFPTFNIPHNMKSMLNASKIIDVHQKPNSTQKILNKF